MRDDRLRPRASILQGLPVGPRVRLDRGHSLLVVGPTQAGKTSSLVVPAILGWNGPVVVTSVKNDVVAITAGVARDAGRRPASRTGPRRRPDLGSPRGIVGLASRPARRPVADE